MQYSALTAQPADLDLCALFDLKRAGRALEVRLKDAQRSQTQGGAPVCQATVVGENGYVTFGVRLATATPQGFQSTVLTALNGQAGDSLDGPWVEARSACFDSACATYALAGHLQLFVLHSFPHGSGGLGNSDTTAVLAAIVKDHFTHSTDAGSSSNSTAPDSSGAGTSTFCPVEAGNAGCSGDQAGTPADSGASPDAASTPTYAAPSEPVAAPPAPSSFAGQAVSCSLWKFTVAKVTPAGDYYSVTGHLVNTSSQSLYAESFTLGINGSGDSLSAYVGSTVDPGGAVLVTFDQSGGTVGGTGPLQSIDSLSSLSGGGGAC